MTGLLVATFLSFFSGVVSVGFGERDEKLGGFVLLLSMIFHFAAGMAGGTILERSTPVFLTLAIMDLLLVLPLALTGSSIWPIFAAGALLARMTVLSLSVFGMNVQIAGDEKALFLLWTLFPASLFFGLIAGKWRKLSQT
ncbi:MAG: hypothetical protein B7Y36_17215 [Novosphingobium sp. 28-62-57]|uniref:hypothetical protein n=1 Tax=Novosphingobium sp. 28-62-57 TaxID=1970409 RepID=UPI000BDC6E1E|nr:hypothetical protein [Novosphingobium sp. 28-62-57]OYZ08234.1 MAG: hypothetical protein B7Y36_17215 [Novosphingobium sp. 28-62-57]OYZ89829.1 MAG: hypothetical protein B7Y00_00860 [Sphingomonadales bacterium 17-56-6]